MFATLTPLVRYRRSEFKIPEQSLRLTSEEAPSSLRLAESNRIRPRKPEPSPTTWLLLRIMFPNCREDPPQPIQALRKPRRYPRKRHWRRRTDSRTDKSFHA